MNSLKKWLRVGKAVSLENNSGKGVLNLLKYICDVKRCTKENRIGVVKTGLYYTADRVFVTLLKTRSGSAVEEGRVARIRNSLLMFG